MSQDIFSTNLYDPNLSTIRNDVQGLDDKYPFLLMPVRLETRYMLVDRPVSGTEVDDEALILMLELQSLLERMELIGIMELMEAKSLEGRIIEIIDILIQKNDDGLSLPYPENEWWEDHQAAILETYDSLVQKFNELPYDTRVQLYDVASSLEIAIAKVEDFKITKAASTEYNGAKVMIDKLNRVEGVFDQVIQKPNDYTPKTKHKYFDFLDLKTDTLNGLCQDIEDMALQNILANTNQIKRIKEFSAVYAGKLSQTQSVFSAIPSEFKRNEFLGIYDNEIQPRFEDFTTIVNEVIVPKLEYIQKLKTVNASTLIYQAKQIQFKLQNINFEGLHNYQHLKETRTQLYGMLRKFRANGHDIISGPTWQIGQLKTTWSQVDQLLDDFNQIVTQVEVIGQYQQAGRSRTISHINENYRADLAGLKQSAVADSVAIQNSQINGSANAFNIANKKLKELTDHLSEMADKPNLNKEELVTTAQEMQDFSDEFAVLATKTTIIPEEYYKSIHSMFSQLQQAVGTIVAKAAGKPDLVQPTIDMSNQTQSVNNSMQELESDITDKNDKFYDDFRKKFIYSDPTETVSELWVRIYPDDIFVNSHEKAVTSDEREDAHFFWTEVWNADGEKDIELAAWRVLVTKYGENRATYLRKAFNAESPQQTKEKPTRDLVRLNRHLDNCRQIIDAIFTQSHYVSSYIEFNLITVKNDLNGSLLSIDHLTEETFFLINKSIESRRLLAEKLNAVYNYILKEVEQGAYAPESMTTALSECVDLLNLIGEKLAGIKPVKTTSDLPFKVVPDFPGVPLKDSPWSQAPRSDVMPERFVLLGVQGGYISHIKVGKVIPNPLIVGINPESVDTGTFEYDENGNLLVDENTKWLTDFETAVETGMAIALPLVPGERSVPFEKLIVLGVKNTNGQESLDLLDELLEAHSYSPDGIGILPIGTPTNNTDSKTSGFNSEDDADKAYDRITGEPLFEVTDQDKNNIDGFRLKEALGIKPELLDRLENADRQDTYKSLMMNRALWYGTMGYYMEEIMDTMFTLDNINRTKKFFTEFVTGRGWLPALRIGSQPYGVLPTTAFDRFKIIGDEELPPITSSDFKNLPANTLDNILQRRYDIRLKNLLNKIREQWLVIANDQNMRISDFDPADTTAQAHFMQLLGLQATSIEQYYRYNTNTAQRRSTLPDVGSSVNFSPDALFGPDNMHALFGDMIDEGYFIDDTHFDKEKVKRIKEARIFRLRYHDNFGTLLGPFVKENGDEFLRSDEGYTYINKLLSTEPRFLWQKSAFEGSYSNSLLFILLRQSLGMAYRDVGLDILMQEQAINENTRRRAGSKGTYLLPGPEQEDVIFTKWDYLFRDFSWLVDMMDVSPFQRFPLSRVLSSNQFWNYVSSTDVKTMANYLFKALNDPQDVMYFPHHDLSKITTLKSDFLELNNLPISELQRLFAEHLDLCTYRFDAWQLGIANKRLDSMRSQPGGQNGIYLGAFGWVENLEPGGERHVKTDLPEQLRENDNKQVYTDDDNEGFIHTPSLNHALTAAILRSGYIANKGAGDLDNQMAVNLTSKRVRMALKLVEGIRGGQEVGALLGYQFERGLHENYLNQGLELDKFIYDLRRQFPLVPDVGSEVDENQNEEQSTMNVVHGENLLEFIRIKLGDDVKTAESLYEVELQHENDLKDDFNFSTAISTIEFRAVLKEIDEMANAFDALADLLMSESVYHIAQGNYVRSGAVFAALAEGRVPPDVQIINTPRTGHVLTQRMILQLEAVDATSLQSNQALAKAPYWENIGLTPMAKAEPSLNKWLGQMIGNPSLIRCYVEYSQGDSPVVYLVRLSDLDMQAADAVYTFGKVGDENSFDLNKMIAYHVRKEAGLGSDIELNIHFKDRNNKLLEDNETLTANIKTINEVLPLFASLYETITKARFTNAEDYIVPGSYIPDDMNLQQLDVDNIEQRVVYALAAFSQYRDALKSIFGAKGIAYNDPALVKEAVYSASEINDFRDKLKQCSGFGIPNVIPDTAAEFDEEAGKTLAKQAADTIRIMDEVIVKSETLLDYPPDLEDQQKINKLVEAAKAIFGKPFVIVPQFTLRNSQEIQQCVTLPHNDGILGFADEYAMDGWIEGISKVRTKINKLEMVNTMTGLFDSDFPTYTPVQLPYNTTVNDEGETVGDFWLGLEYPSTYEPENDKLSLVLLNEESLHADNQNAKCCGLLIDEWIEVIPEREETTGITFNYDQPDAEPPQSLLLAVPPEETGAWKWDDLVYTILDTMDLYKARLVEPEQIDNSIFTQVLPAVMGEYPAPNQYRFGDTMQGMFDLAENNSEINE